MEQKGKKPFECNVCYTAFSQKGDLKRHMESVHKGKKPFECNVCYTAFSKKGKSILYQFMKQRSHSSAMFVILLFLKKEI